MAEPKLSFAQKMMAKMGYQRGAGLGKEGHGMLNPIEVKLRPQLAGVGAIEEKTPQAKAEARRQARQRGEPHDQDSEDEGRKSHRKPKEPSYTRAPTRSHGAKKPKPPGYIIEQLEKEGLNIPAGYKLNFMDCTGEQPRMLTTAAGIMTPQNQTAGATQGDSEKITRVAQLELEHFANGWHELQDRRKFVDLQESQIEQELEQQNREESRFNDLIALVESMSALNLSEAPITLPHSTILSHAETIVSKLEEAAPTFISLDMADALNELAVAVFSPLFRICISLWEPLEDDFPIFSHLRRIHLLVQKDQNISGVDYQHDELPERTIVGSVLSAYDSMILSFWLPKVRNAVINQWDVSDATPMLDLLSQWREILPNCVYYILVNQLVARQLSTLLEKWNPSDTSKEVGPAARPHVWLFPWLEYLDEYHLDPESSNGILAEVRRKYHRALKSSNNPSKGVIQGLDRWREVQSIRQEIDRDLITHLLPRLAQYLHDELEVDPSQQDLQPFNKVLKWLPFFKNDVFGRILVEAFFPKWLQTLHLWLTATPNYDEVAEWFTWWRQDVFPEELVSLPSIDSQWTKGLVMIDEAMNLGPDRVKHELTAPAAGPSRPVEGIESPERQRSPVIRKYDGEEEPTLKDVLENFCEQENLLLISLRKAHPQSGLPLFRITETASGTGGISVYIKGDVVWAQNKRDRNVWEPIDAFSPGVLVGLAESK